MTATKIKVSRWKCKCERCGNEWISQTEDIPLVCYKCKAVTWNRPKKSKA
jgi:Zn finger protein HypA/HybF involved in hydrogenase expression